MRSRFFCSLLVAVSISPLAHSQSAAGQSLPRNGDDVSSNVEPLLKVPAGVILVKGAWSSASDSVTPVPEGGSIANHVFRDAYFGMTYVLPADWTEQYKGPPPSDSGRYVLAQISPADAFKGPARGNILIVAQDMFFTPAPAKNTWELINNMKDNLQTDYKVEILPRQTRIAGRSFIFFAYWSPVAQLHWYVLATQIRCHALQIILSSRDTNLLNNLMAEMNAMELPAEASATGGTGGGAVPVCIEDYARGRHVIERVNPVLTEHRYNPVPGRIIIDTHGKVKHIHFLSAFSDQAQAITQALNQWKFRPYQQKGQPIEVETGIRFGQASHRCTTGAPCGGRGGSLSR